MIKFRKKKVLKKVKETLDFFQTIVIYLMCYFYLNYRIKSNEVVMNLSSSLSLSILLYLFIIHCFNLNLYVFGNSAKSSFMLLFRIISL